MALVPVSHDGWEEIVKEDWVGWGSMGHWPEDHGDFATYLIKIELNGNYLSVCKSFLHSQ